LYEPGTGEIRCPSCKSSVYIVSCLETQADPSKPDKKFGFSYIEALFDNIRSAWNVGSMFRTADGFGIRHLYLCGMTPTPQNSNVAKTSLGAENFIEWTYEKNGVDKIYKLKELNYMIVAIEEHRKAENIYTIDPFNFPNPLVLVVGNENCGVDPGILEISDLILNIPMLGIKKSLNVAVAFGIAVSTLQHGLLKQHNS
jgi:tRNA G18 (ribose-2'-O)-methylase SpoU